MILYINTMLTESRLQVHYDSGLLPPSDSRPDIFKYMLSSLSVINFSGVYIYYKFDDDMPDRFGEIDKHIYECFPDARVHHYRAEHQKQWIEAIDQIKKNHPNELVWLLNNDDHIFIDSNTEYLNRLTRRMRELAVAYPFVGLLFTHWAHLLGDFYLWKRIGKGAPFIEDTPDYVALPHRESGSAMILTMAALEDFWYQRDLGNEVHFRIDRIPSPEMLFVYPKRELVRHYDAYAHHGMDLRRIPPMRIPPGFFERQIRINYCSDIYLPDHVNVNPLKPAYRAADPTGVDLRCHKDELPLFWRDRISEVRSDNVPEETVLTAHHNRAVYENAAASAPNYPVDFREVVPAAFRSINGEVPISPENPDLRISSVLKNIYFKLSNRLGSQLRHSVVLLDYDNKGRETVLSFGQSVKDMPDVEVIWLSLATQPSCALLRSEAQYLDSVIDCHFEQEVHKGIALNTALCSSKGEVITVCDLAYANSVVSPGLTTEVAKRFYPDGTGPARTIVLETTLFEVQTRYDNQQIVDPRTIPTWHRACLSFRRADAIAFGGFDEHPELSGLCGGAYELCSRMAAHGTPLELLNQPGLFYFLSLPLLQMNGIASVIVEHQDPPPGKLPRMESPQVRNLRLRM